jgi:hypothetical protein
MSYSVELCHCNVVKKHGMNSVKMVYTSKVRNSEQGQDEEVKETCVLQLAVQ